MTDDERIAAAQARIAHEPRIPRPYCPACGSYDGWLGTENAYFCCQVCKREVYWTHDHNHPGDWKVALLASPWAKARG